MANPRLIKVPKIKHEQAKLAQAQMRKQTGMNVPLWKALVETEKRMGRKKRKDLFWGLK